LFQPRPVPASAYFDRFRTGAGRRALGLGLTLLIEALLLVVLLTLGSEKVRGIDDAHTRMISIRAEEVRQEAPEEPKARPEPERRPEARPETRRPEPREPQPPQPVQPPAAPPAVPSPTGIIHMPWSLAPPNPLRLPDRPAAPSRPVYGPANNPSVMQRDTARVGTAPNGEPLYAAEWYREPDARMMRAYLSSAHGPGWGLIACRTAPEFRVEDCVGLGEYPEGSQITRSALAAAWEFRVRPPRRGGQVLVGSWVRIRIDYH
jgi:protein TonB